MLKKLLLIMVLSLVAIDSSAAADFADEIGEAGRAEARKRELEAQMRLTEAELDRFHAEHPGTIPELRARGEVAVADRKKQLLDKVLLLLRISGDYGSLAAGSFRLTLAKDEAMRKFQDRNAPQLQLPTGANSNAEADIAARAVASAKAELAKEFGESFAEYRELKEEVAKSRRLVAAREAELAALLAAEAAAVGAAKSDAIAALDMRHSST